MKIKIYICLLIAFALYACGKDEQYIGERYLDAQYLQNPLGESVFPDDDPLIREDAFDCATFVETALAKGNLDTLTKIRYKNGKIDLLNRNHFIETDWLPNNSDIIENVSNQYGKTAIRTVVIDKKKWFKKIYNIDTDFAPETVNIEYIPYSELRPLTIEKPLIVLFISGNSKICDKIGTDLAVTHMGFLLPNGKLRHASQTHKCVIDVDFGQYVDRKKQNKNNIGIALVKIK